MRSDEVLLWNDLELSEKNSKGWILSNAGENMSGPAADAPLPVGATTPAQASSPQSERLGDSEPRTPLETSPPEPPFLKLRPLTTARIAQAFDAIGYELEESETPTVRTPQFEMRGSVIGTGTGTGTPALYLRFFIRRNHPLGGYGALLSTANEINMTRVAVKAHVKVESTTVPLAAAQGGDSGAIPSFTSASSENLNPTQSSSSGQAVPFCVMIVECEVPVGTGLADVQLYDIVVHAARVVENVTATYAHLRSAPDVPKPQPESLPSGF